MDANASRLTTEQTIAIMKMVGEGFTPYDIAKKLDLDYHQVYRAIERNLARIERLEAKRIRNSAAFKQVMSRFFDIMSVLGHPGALDYSQVTGGQGAQYAKRDPFTLIDFTVDVTVTARHLNDEGKVFFAQTISEQDIEPNVQTAEYLDYVQALGEMFIRRGLFPVTDYFGKKVKGEEG